MAAHCPPIEILVLGPNLVKVGYVFIRKPYLKAI